MKTKKATVHATLELDRAVFGDWLVSQGPVDGVRQPGIVADGAHVREIAVEDVAENDHRLVQHCALESHRARQADDTFAATDDLLGVELGRQQLDVGHRLELAIKRQGLQRDRRRMFLDVQAHRHRQAKGDGLDHAQFINVIRCQDRG